MERKKIQQIIFFLCGIILSAVIGSMIMVINYYNNHIKMGKYVIIVLLKDILPIGFIIGLISAGILILVLLLYYKIIK